MDVFVCIGSICMLVRVTVLHIYINVFDCAYVACCLFMPVCLYELVCSCYCVCAVVALEWNMDIFHGAEFTETVLVGPGLCSYLDSVFMHWTTTTISIRERWIRVCLLCSALI